MMSKQYDEDTSTDFRNPDRGWQIGQYPNGSPLPLNAAVSGPLGVLQPIYELADFKDGTPLSGAWLSSFESDLEDFDSLGYKGTFLFAYDFDDLGAPYEPTNQNDILHHVEQIAEVLSDYKRNICSVYAGMVGPWGEWAYGDSTFFPKLIQKWLDNLPSDVMIEARYPGRVYQWDSGDRLYKDRFDGSDLMRVGIWNDCIFTNELHGGTFYSGNGLSEASARSFMATLVPYAPYGGQTCGPEAGTPLNKWNDPEEVEAHIAMYPIDYQHGNWWEGILQKWEQVGYMDEYSRSLGYRLVLKRASTAVKAKPGQMVPVQLRMDNVGNGKVFNVRPIDLVFKAENGTTETVRLTGDARRDLPLARTANVDMIYTCRIPQLSPGSYSLHLALPDPTLELAGDWRYSIRLANTGMWDQTHGRNDLGMAMEITA